MTPAAICIFGEVLFDHFPDGRRVLGGAPFNVAWHLQAFGLAPRFISRVGTDAEGDEILDAMRDWGMDTRLVQRDSQRPTGRVSVTMADGEPTYDIVRDCAYDAIETPDTDLPADALFYHGSLATRMPQSRHSLDALLHRLQPRLVFLDVNLRPPWWEAGAVLAMVRRADWVKLNRDELDWLHPVHGENSAQAGEFLAENGLRGLVLTMGAAGAHALTTGGEHYVVRPAQTTGVVDTVGAGDAFAAIMILGLCRQWPLVQTLERAQAFASRVVGLRGATVRNREFYRPLCEEWGLGGSAGG